MQISSSLLWQLLTLLQRCRLCLTCSNHESFHYYWAPQQDTGWESTQNNNLNSQIKKKTLLGQAVDIAGLLPSRARTLEPRHWADVLSCPLCLVPGKYHSCFPPGLFQNLILIVFSSREVKTQGFQVDLQTGSQLTWTESSASRAKPNTALISLLFPRSTRCLMSLLSMERKDRSPISFSACPN